MHFFLYSGCGFGIVHPMCPTDRFWPNGTRLKGKKYRVPSTPYKVVGTWKDYGVLPINCTIVVPEYFLHVLCKAPNKHVFVYLDSVRSLCTSYSFHFSPASHVVNKMSKVPDHLVNRYLNLPREWETGQNSKLGTGYTPQHVDSGGYSSYRDRLLIRIFNDIGSVKELGPTPRWLHSHVSHE